MAVVLASFERWFRFSGWLLARFGSDLLSHVLRRSTIGVPALNGRVRDGIGCFTGTMTTKPRKKPISVVAAVPVRAVLLGLRRRGGVLAWPGTAVLRQRALFQPLSKSGCCICRATAVVVSGAGF